MGIAAWSGALLDWEAELAALKARLGNFWAQGAEGDGERLS